MSEERRNAMKLGSWISALALVVVSGSAIAQNETLIILPE
jgi:hypothetical protein